MNERAFTMARRVASAAGLLASVAVAQEPARRGPPAPAFDVAQAFESGSSGPESVTTDADGNLYLSLGQRLMRRTIEGDVELFSTLPLPIFALGVKVGPDGCLYNASASLSEAPGAFVWRTCEPHASEVLAELDQTGLPNDLAFDTAGNLFVTDPGLGRVWQVSADGGVSVLVEHPSLAGDPAAPALLFRSLGANGIAFDACERFLYVSNTDQGSVLRIDPLAASPVPELVVQAPQLRGADGIAFDRDGTLFVTVNASDALVAVSPHGQPEVLGLGGLLDAPSSLVFGATRADRHRLYLTSSAFSRTLGLQPGTPQPALLVAPVRTPGAPLPLR